MPVVTRSQSKKLSNKNTKIITNSLKKRKQEEVDDEDIEKLEEIQEEVNELQQLNNLMIIKAVTDHSMSMLNKLEKIKNFEYKLEAAIDTYNYIYDSLIIFEEFTNISKVLYLRILSLFNSCFCSCCILQNELIKYDIKNINNKLLVDKFCSIATKLRQYNCSDLLK